MNKEILQKIFLAGVLPFYILFIAPISFYYGNQADVSYSIPSVILPVFLLFVLSVLILLLFLLVSSSTKKLDSIIVTIYLGFSICIWVQSQIFVWNFGPLDGRGLKFTDWKTQSLVELASWIIITAATYFLLIRHGEKAKAILLKSAYGLGIASIAISFLTNLTNTPEANVNIELISESTPGGNVFTLHENNNTIIIILDTFQSDYFDVVRRSHPNDIQHLEGFTFYRNTISNFPTTRTSIPALLTGSIYKNLIPFDQYEQNAFSHYDLRDTFLNKNYSVNSVSNSAMPPGSVSMSEILSHYDVSTTPGWLFYLDYGFFRSAPILLKPLIYNETSWLLSNIYDKNYPPERHGVDIRFLELFEKEADVLNSNPFDGAFLLMHFMLPHPPNRVDEMLNYDPELEGSEGYIHQVRGTLLLTKRILNKLKEHNIYDSSEIFILADHGTLTNLLSDTENPDIVPNIESRVQSSALALFLHKKPGAKGDLTVDDSPLQISDFPCIIDRAIEAIDCSDYNNALSDSSRRREYQFYDLSESSWGMEYFPTMTQYFLEGSSYDPKAWEKGSISYNAGQIITIEKESSEYNLGEMVKFESSNPPEQYLLTGWSFQEGGHRWTDGSSAYLSFKINIDQLVDLELQMQGSGYFDDSMYDAQIIEVYINGHHATQWAVNQNAWHTAPIAKDWIGQDGSLTIQLNLQNPSRPSTDGRLLGFAARQMKILTDDTRN